MSDYFDLIENYVDGHLNDNEKLEFETRIKSDYELKSQYESYLAAQSALEYQSELALRTHLKNKEVEPKKESRIRNLNLRTYLSIAASLVFLVVVGYFLISPQQSSQELAFQFYEAPTSQMIRSTNSSDLWNEAVSAFDNKELKTAENLFVQFSEVDSMSLVAEYYLAHTYFQKEEYSKALPIFQKLELIEGFRTTCEWYGLLTELALSSKPGLLLKKVERIANDSNHFYSKQADLLVKEIK